MKAEPESRIEKGHDIKFSIDDLAAKTEPEPWDGMLFLTHVLHVNINTNVLKGIRAYPGVSPCPSVLQYHHLYIH